MGQFFHSVTLDQTKCKGCINCIKRCPTEAIRVQNSKAKIIKERCIDCGECIKICPQHAKKPIYDSLSVLDNFEYTIALPAPALYAQFNNLNDVDIILNALKLMGFDDVYEVAAAAEIVSKATRNYLAKEDVKKPVLSSACPAVTRLIRVKFPGLIDNVLPFNSPAEISARIAKQKAHEKTGIPMEKIGAIFISPCPAKMTASKMPLGTDVSEISAVISISEIYPKLLKYMKEIGENPPEELSQVGKIGVSWAGSSGEASALLHDSYLAADGIENVMRVLEDLEDEKLGHLEFIELNACSAGCVGGVSTVENPYIAKTKLKMLRKYLPVAQTHIDVIPNEVNWDTKLEYEPVLKLDTDVGKAITKLNLMEEIENSLPGLDCGSCGAPSCRALAEDVVRGFAKTDDCIFKFKENLTRIMCDLNNIKQSIPDSFGIINDGGNKSDS